MVLAYFQWAFAVLNFRTVTSSTLFLFNQITCGFLLRQLLLGFFSNKNMPGLLVTVQGREPQHLLVDCGKTFEEATILRGILGDF